MKFLCRNCKAKYQIADDKVAGRTLRMTCTQCGEAIAVRGAGRSSGSVSQPLSQRPMALGAEQLPSPLRADFQRQVASPAAEVAAARGGAAEWHVAINDVPVGPMRREEVARKIAAGAVDREALAWREGMDDWLPTKHIPELAALFEQRAPARMSAPPPPPNVSMAPRAPLQPAARVEMAPMGGHQVMTLDDYAPPMEMVAPMMAMSPVVSESAAGPKALGWAPMFALVSGGALILMMGVVVGARVLAPAQTPAAVVHTAAVPAAAPAAPAAPTNEPARGGTMIELDMQAIDGQSGSNPQRRSGTGAAAGADKSKGGQGLTEEQKATLARMGGNLDQGPNLQARGETPRPSAGGGGGSGQLTSQQLSEVVLRGRKNLQRCYEVALRGAQSDETVRLDVDLEVSPNGNVTSVHANGKGLPGMEECITRTVRMWRFPSSGEATQTRFPVVFQPGA
jgi:predicted Zn finger-like uncharacterized protein